MLLFSPLSSSGPQATVIPLLVTGVICLAALCLLSFRHHLSQTHAERLIKYTKQECVYIYLPTYLPFIIIHIMCIHIEGIDVYDKKYQVYVYICLICHVYLRMCVWFYVAPKECCTAYSVYWSDSAGASNYPPGIMGWIAMLRPW